MTINYNPGIVSSGLVFCADAGNPRSYPGSGSTWYDASNNALGTLTNGPVYTSGVSGYFTFDGVNDYASFAYQPSTNTPNGCTYEVWLYPTGSDGEVVTRGTSDSGANPDNPRLYVSAAGNIYWDWSITGTDKYMNSNSNCNINAWNQIVGVAPAGGSLGIYLNTANVSGTSVGGNLANPLNNTNDPIIIGGVNWIPRYFNGRIAIVRIYNRVLTTTEITQNFNATRGRYGV
jgi:hypothetical protein